MSRRRNRRTYSRADTKAEPLNVPKFTQPAPNRGQSVIQDIDTFVAGINQWSSKLYINPDEAYRNARTQQSAMRRDPVVMQPLRQRQLGTALLKWQVVPEDKNNREQKDVCSELTKTLANIPHFLKLRMALLEAIWFGRYAVELDYRWSDVNNDELIIHGWKPRHGDKLAFEHETGRVGIYTRVYGETGEDVRFSYESRVKMLSDDQRARLVVHKHEIEDGEYWEPETGGMIHGVGLRTRVYWPWWIKQTASQWLLEYLERSGQGLTIWFFEAGNPADEDATRSAAEQFTGSNVIIAPMAIGSERPFERVKRIDPSAGGAQMFKDVIDDYLGKQIRGMIVGQESTSQAVATGLGSEIAKVQQDVFNQIVEFDAINLGETITHEVLDTLVQWNYGKMDWKPKFELVIKEQDPDKILQAAQAFQAMGGAVGERQLREQIGLEEPEPGDRILGQSAGVPGQPTAQGLPTAGVVDDAGDTLFNHVAAADTLFTHDDAEGTLFGDGADAKGTLFNKEPMKYSWNEQEHPRENDGKFAEKGSDTLSDKDWWNQLSNMAESIIPSRDNMNSFVDSHLPKRFDDDTKRKVSSAFKSVISGMNDKAVERISSNITSIRFHNEQDAIKSELESIKGVKYPSNAKIGGCYNHNDGTLFLYGRVDSVSLDGVYAHEIAHAIDRHHIFSDTTEWYMAWSSEISNNHQLSVYAGTSPAEGFAEFGRMLFTLSGEPRKDAIRAFPKCYEFWKSRGLV